MNGPTNQTYWQTLRAGIRTSLAGLRLSFRHLKNARRSRNADYVDQPGYFDQDTGIVTLQYPRESLPVPDVGRYRLHNEIEDCIVCDKCAKICPVDCIEIEAVKATEEIGKASDGSPIRLYAARFDIDMAKCCYCGLCTTVCPTECLTMTKAYDYSEFDVKDFIYAYSNLTPAEADEKRRLLDEFQREKEALKAAKAVPGVATSAVPAAVPAEGTAAPAARPAFRPGAPKRPAPTAEVPAEPMPVPEPPAAEAPKPRPVFKPGMKKPAAEVPPAPVEAAAPTAEVWISPEPAAGVPAPPKPRPVFKPRGAAPAQPVPPPESETTPPVAEVPGTEVPPAPPEVPAEPVAEAPKPPRPRPVFKPAPRKPPEE